MLEYSATRTDEEANERLDDDGAPPDRPRPAARHLLRIDRWMPAVVTLDVTWRPAPVP